jgi:hypothetical protein
MNSVLQQILNELAQLTPEEQWQVMGYLMNQLQHRAVVTAKPTKSWQEIEGVAPNLLGGVDAQDYVNSLRDEWDEREQQLIKT